MHKLHHFVLALLVASVSYLGASSTAWAGYRTCIKWEIKTDDSGRTIQNGPDKDLTEDKYSNADSGIIASAVGVRVRVQGFDGFDNTYDTEPGTGCFNWNGPSQSYSVRVYAYQTDSAGNYVRMYDYDVDCDGWQNNGYPGDTISALIQGYLPSGGTDPLYVGDYGAAPYWTGQAMLGYALYRYHGPLQNKAIHAMRDDASGCETRGDSAHFGDSNGHITDGYHCIRLTDCAAERDIDSKFTVVHEAGHAVAALHYGAQTGASNGGEPNVDSQWSGTVDEPWCLNQPKYDITDVEYNSVGFREGFAHFYAARVFNDKNASGAFNWKNHQNGAHDLERYFFGTGTTAGGTIENICCDVASCRTGNGMIGDWMRFFWDWYTNQSTSCPYQPHGGDMLDLYAQTRLNGGLQRDNYFSKMRAAAQDLSLQSCLETTRFDVYAGHNGIDNE